MIAHAARRFALGRRWDALQSDSWALADMWRAKQLAEPTDPLPDDFPFRGRLIATGYYLGLADLAGVTVDELLEIGCGVFSFEEAAAIVAALPEGYSALEIYG